MLCRKTALARLMYGCNMLNELGHDSGDLVLRLVHVHGGGGQFDVVNTLWNLRLLDFHLPLDLFGYELGKLRLKLCLKVLDYAVDVFSKFEGLRLPHNFTSVDHFVTRIGNAWLKLEGAALVKHIEELKCTKLAF